jgi:hypothetical protein
MNGSIFYKIQEPLVNMRSGPAQLKRRSGFKYAKAEYAFATSLHRMGYLTGFEFVRNLALRVTPRLMPEQTIELIYRLLRDLN